MAYKQNTEVSLWVVKFSSVLCKERLWYNLCSPESKVHFLLSILFNIINVICSIIQYCILYMIWSLSWQSSALIEQSVKRVVVTYKKSPNFSFLLCNPCDKLITGDLLINYFCLATDLSANSVPDVHLYLLWTTDQLLFISFHLFWDI